MRRQTREFVEKFLEEKFIPAKAIDIGSAHISGNIRPIFEKRITGDLLSRYFKIKRKEFDEVFGDLANPEMILFE